MRSVGRLFGLSRIHGTGRPGSSGRDSQAPRHIFGASDMPSNGSSQNPTPYLSMDPPREGSESGHLANPVTRPQRYPRPSTPGPINLPPRALHHQPTRLDLIEDPLPVTWTGSTLEEQWDLPKEIEKRSGEASQGWNSTFHAMEELILPPTLVHPGAERYIDKELKGRPKWLWDSHTGATVLARDSMFDEGFVAVSYTWGRWREDWRTIPGTPWLVPSTRQYNPDIPDMVCNFDITQLMDILRRMRNFRYFWIDVLCINQKPQNEEQAAEKTEEIEKQGAIFKEANGVLVYLWSVDNGEHFVRAVHELGEMVRRYWQIGVSQQGQAITDQPEGDEICIDEFGQALRGDPWFSSLWTLQEMILAPASVWIARDGSHCRVNGDILTTHSMADKFQDFVFRERLYDTLGSLSFGPTRSHVLSNIPESQVQFKEILQGWLAWAFRETSITSCLVESRSGILQGSLQREYSGRRELAVLAALKVGNEKRYDAEPTLVGGLPVTLWNELIQAEGGRIFESSQPPATLLTDMLPTNAGFVSLFRGIREVCPGWELKENGELFIPQGTLIGQFSNRNATEYQMADKTILGGDPSNVVKAHLSMKGIDIKHVRFVVIGFQPPYQKLGNGHFEFCGIRGVILVTLSQDVYGDDCRWHKAGMFFSRDFRREYLEHDIIVVAAA